MIDPSFLVGAWLLNEYAKGRDSSRRQGEFFEGVKDLCEYLAPELNHNIEFNEFYREQKEVLANSILDIEHLVEECTNSEGCVVFDREEFNNIMNVLRLSLQRLDSFKP